VDDAKTAAARALNPLLEVFHALDGQKLRAVWRIYDHACLSTIILEFTQQWLVIRANPADDTIELSVDHRAIPDSQRTCANDDAPWKRWIGADFGWGWVVTNQQGYCDGAMLSFGGITPQLLIIVEASSLKEIAFRESPHTSSPES
jgi:hypothetical protein